MSDPNLQPASFAEFEQECRRGNVVAVTRTLRSRKIDPLDAYVMVAGDSAYSFLFESVEGGEAVAKYSFLAAEPYLIVRGRDELTTIDKQGTRETLNQNLPEFLRKHFNHYKLAESGGQGPLAGGAVGYFGYGSARWFEPAVNKREGQLDASDTGDDACFMFCRQLVVFDRAQESMKIVAVVFTDEVGGGSSLKNLYDAAVAKTEHLQSILFAVAEPNDRAAPASAPLESEMENLEANVRSNWTRENFEAGVDQIKEHIFAGDCYQAVLSQRFTRPTSADAVSIYRALRQSNPAPYTYLLKFADEAIIGASPEMLVRCRGQRLDYRPIAGTRRRGATAVEDEALAEEMRHDEKEVAEHMMLVDLGRNDLGRVATYGSVKVDELMTVERYSKVQHLVSSLSARLEAGRDRFDALAACFPAGTVTGAPKVRAMEIVDGLEPDRRGMYAGAVLYIDYADNLDSCIAIRTIVLKGGQASVQAGAGIVADSVPEREFEETLHKAHALLRAIEFAEGSA
jgi:anthranilate synthase component 1